MNREKKRFLYDRDFLQILIRHLNGLSWFLLSKALSWRLIDVVWKGNLRLAMNSNKNRNLKCFWRPTGSEKHKNYFRGQKCVNRNVEKEMLEAKKFFLKIFCFLKEFSWNSGKFLEHKKLFKARSLTGTLIKLLWRSLKNFFPFPNIIICLQTKTNRARFPCRETSGVVFIRSALIISLPDPDSR